MNEQPHENNPNKGIGKTMMVFAWLTALGLLVLLFGEFEKNIENPNRSPESLQTSSTNTVILKRNRFNHYVSNGTINGSTVTFLLDTGATDVVIPEKIANELRLIKGQQQFARTANGVITVFNTTLKELTMGDITLYDVNASINPAMHDPQILLGMSALKNIEFTQRGNQLTLKQYR